MGRNGSKRAGSAEILHFFQDFPEPLCPQNTHCNIGRRFGLR